MPIGPIMLDIAGTHLSQEDSELLQHPMVGGVILFSRNYESPEQLTSLIYAIRESRTSPILISVDQEGGRVQRFKEEFSELPSFASYGKLFDADPEKALQLAEKGGWLMAIECLTVGIDFSFTPVLDLNVGVSDVIGHRSFHADPEIIIKLAKAFIKGMHSAGMKAIGKHFPGHGSVVADSHFALPVDTRSPDEILQTDIIPFMRLAKNELTAIMPAHIVFSQLDDKAVTFSPFWLQKILRGQAGFTGAIVSDDLSMAGAESVGDFATRFNLATEAGCDICLVCNNREAVYQILDAVPYRSNALSEQRLLKMCGRFQYTRTELVHSHMWQQISTEIKNHLKDVTTN